MAFYWALKQLRHNHHCIELNATRPTLQFVRTSGAPRVSKYSSTSDSIINLVWLNVLTTYLTSKWNPNSGRWSPQTPYLQQRPLIIYKLVSILYISCKVLIIALLIRHSSYLPCQVCWRHQFLIGIPRVLQSLPMAILLRDLLENMETQCRNSITLLGASQRRPATSFVEKIK